MDKSAQLKKLLQLKELRVQKARADLVAKRRDAKTKQTQLDNMRTAYETKLEEIDAFAGDLFLELKEEDNTAAFFTGLTLGVFRRRKEAAALKIKVGRVENKKRRADDLLTQAAQTYNELDRSKVAIGKLYDDHKTAEDGAAEQKGEEALAELLRKGRNGA